MQITNSFVSEWRCTYKILLKADRITASSRASLQMLYLPVCVATFMSCWWKQGENDQLSLSY